MNCNNCGLELDDYEEILNNNNDWKHPFCLKCIRSKDVEREQLLKEAHTG